MLLNGAGFSRAVRFAWRNNRENGFRPHGSESEFRFSDKIIPIGMPRQRLVKVNRG
jgi:hypothetical protein